MKKWLQSYFIFTRAEKTGLVALFAVLFVLIVIRATIPLWVHPDESPDKEKKLVAAWEAFKRSHPGSKSNDTAVADEQSSLPDSIDLNTADFATLVRLKGIGPVTANKIIERRSHKGPFTSLEQLSETGGFSAATLTDLKKHLFIYPSKTEVKKNIDR